MHARCWLVALVGLVAQQVYGVDSPEATTHVARYGIHETPTDPNSPLVFLVTLSLTSKAGDGTKTGWSIAELEIRQVAPSGGADRVWTERDPHVATADGLWWVSHANVASPEPEEFVLPPHLTGTALAADPNAANLDYDFLGVAYSPPAAPELPPYAVTAAVTFEFHVEGDPAPIGTGSEEPADGDPPIQN